MSYSELCQDIINEKIASEIFNETKKIKFLRKVAIRKTKLIKIPEDFKPPIAEPIVEEQEPAVEEPAVEEPIADNTADSKNLE